MKNSIITLCLMFCLNAIGQNVGVGTINPDENSSLEIYSTDKGFLLTRLPLNATDDSTPLTQHVEGMTTYNTYESTTTGTTSVYPGVYYNDGSKWNYMGPNTLALGDIKHSLEPSDHSGWFLLNGRAITSLPTIAKNNAAAIGIGANLPDSSDRLIKTNNGTETILSVAGNNSVTLTQANLPNVTYSTTTSVGGSHTHTYSDSYNAAKTLGLATNVLPLVPLISENVGANESVPANLYPSADNGSHSHSVTVPSGGSGVPLNITPKHLITNVFIYLGE
ncbi:hypothetical protein LZZ90_06720 [Flavobacterium sp. SM15]|uniref:hypothetical protein n=1 Tax=Flavobacterium sp. SM15 TaxID=2908005 RepID=UPI001EDA3A95|nr:hypothetical protein [Flavobacterium sp. SM15]MCG2611195.1 hypothetical protein [Flavobacterium sp. SM15]